MWSSGNLSTVQWLCLRLCLVHVKYFSENKYFSEMLFSGKENIFKCLVAFQKMFWKIFSSVWLCSWKYHRKYIFYLLFTFSQLPNKYIISFLNTETQKKQNPEKKFIKFGQIERRRKREVCGAAIGAVRSLLRSARCEVRCCDRSGAIGSVCGCWTGARSEECTTVVVELELGLRTGLSLLPLSLFLSLCLCAWVWKWFEVKIFTSNHFWVKALKTHGHLKIIFEKFIFHAQPNTRIYGKAFSEVIWSQNKHSLRL